MIFNDNTHLIVCQTHQTANGVNANTLDKLLEEGQVKMMFAPLIHFFQCFMAGHAPVIAAIAGDGVIDIDNGRHLTKQANLITRQLQRIAVAIKT